MTSAPVLTVHELTIRVGTDGPAILDNVAFDLQAGEVLAVVGESGSGKSTLGLSLLGHTRPGLQVTSGTILVEGQDMVSLPSDELGSVRGSVIAYVPQDASISIDPGRRLHFLLDELLRTHRPGADKRERQAVMRRALGDVGLPMDPAFRRRYIHQLSGGQQQRFGIALALVLEPKVLVLDEPTTGLDALTQEGILEAVRAACRSRDAAAIFITHDLEVVRSIADRILVLYAGRVAEEGLRQLLLDAPAHPYTRGLIQSAPRVEQVARLRGIPGTAPAAADRPMGCAFHPRCYRADETCGSVQPPLRALEAGRLIACHHPQADQVESLVVGRASERGSSDLDELAAKDLTIAYGRNQVVHGVSLKIQRGRCLGLVGASGSGKTTLSRAIVGLVSPSAGTVTLNGAPLAPSVEDRSDQARRALQYVFQNPYSSLNPRRTVLELLAQPAHAFGLEYSRTIASSWLDRVAISSRVLDRRPDALSGGERQRIAIARALACDPMYLICDEITAPLDVSVQATIVELIRDIMIDSHVGILFVTHDLGVMRSLADDIAVFQAGECIEFSASETLFTAPTAEYTRSLVEAAGARSSP
jgi:peptide/nickel transport system ATP-binding protein